MSRLVLFSELYIYLEYERKSFGPGRLVIARRSIESQEFCDYQITYIEYHSHLFPRSLETSKCNKIYIMLNSQLMKTLEFKVFQEQGKNI